MDTSSTREYPEHRFETEIVGQCIVEHHRGAGHIGPALAANLGSRATSTHVVVISHIDIEYHLFSHGHEDFFLSGQVILGWNVEHSTDINLVRSTGNQSLLELFRRFEAQVSAINIIFEGEGELTVVESF